jgi:hypothetical protein
VAAEEADETEHWLEVLSASGAVENRTDVNELEWLMTEASELRAIFVQAVRTARFNLAGTRNRK